MCESYSESKISCCITVGQYVQSGDHSSSLAISFVAAECVLQETKKVIESMHLRNRGLRQQTPEATD